MPERLFREMSQASHNVALRLYRAQNAVWLAVGLSSAISAIAWILDPSAAAKASAIGKELQGPYDDLWNYFIGIGGVFVFAGIWWYRVRMELFGHFILGGGLGVYALAILTANPGVTPALFLTTGLAVASSVTIWFRWRTTPKKSA